MAQKVFKTVVDGEVSNQPWKNKSILQFCSTRSWVFWESKSKYKDGSDLIKAIQTMLKKKKLYKGDIDGWCGETTVIALQKFLGVTEKHKSKYTLGETTVKAFQKYLNKQV